MSSKKMSSTALTVLRSGCDRKHEINFDLSQSLHEFKQLLVTTVGIPVKVQRIFYLGRELKTSGRSLSSLGVDLPAVLHVHSNTIPVLDDDDGNDKDDDDEVIEVVDPPPAQRRGRRRQRTTAATASLSQPPQQQSTRNNSNNKHVVSLLDDDDEEEEEKDDEKEAPRAKSRRKRRCV